MKTNEKKLQEPYTENADSQNQPKKPVTEQAVTAATIKSSRAQEADFKC